MSIKRKLIRNTVFNIGIRGWSSVLATLVLTPIIIYYIGVAEYGIYILVGALTGYFALLDLGIGTSVVKFIAEYHARGEKEKVNEIVNTAYFLFLGVGVVGSIGIFIIGTFFIDIFNLDSELLWKARILIYILAAGFIMSFSMALFGDVLRGMQRYDTIAYISFGMSLVNLVVTLAVLLSGYGIVELVLYTIIFGLIGRVVTAYYAKKTLPYLDIKLKFVNKTRVRSLFSLSMLLFVLFAFNRIIFYTDALVIGLFLSVSMVAFYAVAQKIYSIPARSLNATMHAMIPAASELDALQQKRILQKLFLRVLKYSLSMLFMLSIPTVFLARHILTYWIGWIGVGFQYYYWVTIVLIVSLFFDYFNYVSSQILIGMNRLKFFVACYGVVALLNLALSIVLIHKMGIVGVALGTTIPFVVMAPVLMWHSFRVLDIKWLEYIKTVWFPNIPFALLNTAVIYSILFFHKPVSLIEVIMYYIISISVFFIPFYFKGLDKRERNDIRYIFSTVIRREPEDTAETEF